MRLEHTPEDAHAHEGDRRRARSTTRRAASSGPRRCPDRAASNTSGSRKRRKRFLVRKDGHVFSFVYPPEHERAAIRALTGCPRLDPADVLALVCYLGHDPHELGLDKPA